MKIPLPQWPPKGSANRVTIERIDGTHVTVLYVRSLWNRRKSNDLRVRLIDLQDTRIDYYVVVSRMTGLRFILPRKCLAKTRKSMRDPTPRKSATIGIEDTPTSHHTLKRQWTDVFYGGPSNYETLRKDWIWNT